ncbi:SusD/RagB family nutrient-binding outer membrane lipoprotein [Mangrovimonas sp. TPBH4]|uniref:SusD/RagB family nutrient-binding outer membrane lipoprotein n=1 Tax=Mangrovimonas sp. TPBH4 TaxID=1645914 RepID=UPI0006B45819|nr:SusD/RagB family nutrient-binding outer membrane lipoprotein [Mangrovimonas sp. TPBH4]
MKLNLYKTKKLVLLGGVLATTLSCTKDFEEVNTNPNYPGSASPEYLIPGIMRELGYNWGGKAWEEGFTTVQYAARLQFTDQDRYIWNATSNPYNFVYDSMRDVMNVINVSQDNENMQGYYGVGLVLKSFIYSYATDAYGDVPYANAIMGLRDNNITPDFSYQSEIYDGMLNDLLLANEALANATNISGDIIYGGNVGMWRKFANSLRLRLLMRISDVDQARAQQEMQQIVSNPSQYPIFGGNEDMAVIQWNTDNPQPKYTTRSGSFDEVRLSETLETRLKAFNDTRLKVFAQPTSASGAGIYSDNWDDYVGMPNGLDDEAALSYSPSGNPEESGSNYISRMGILLACRACNTEMASATAAQTILMSYSELAFILAEAKERGLISAGDTAQNYYENGIVASFEYYTERVAEWTEIANAMANTDLDAYLGQTGVLYTGSTEEKLELIALQKWFGLFYTGIEGWSDWRRTAMPEVVPGPSATNGGKVPVRFMYPNDVKSTNNANYQNAVNHMGGDDINVRLWWDVVDNN